jgi:tocopherol cyclase
MLKSARNPDLYHGTNKKANFFEGWYFKIVHPYKNYTYCFIPGIFISSKEEHSHSFIQIVDGYGPDFKYLRFRKDEFEASSEEFDINICGSSFSLDGINLNIGNQGEKIFGKLSFRNIAKWPDSIINPGSMGFYNYLNFMECYSQVCAIDGDIEGSLLINNEKIDFTGGKVYIEKNWGKAFPYSYIWVQGNSFEKEKAALTCSIAHIPFPIKSFTGFLIGIYVKEKVYKFTTINKSELSIIYEKERIILEVHNKDYFLRIEAEYNEETFIDLLAPREDNMVPIARETLQGKLTATLYDKKTQCNLLSDNCTSAGVEFSGDYRSLFVKKR